jgi:hypothetical protein
LLLAFWTSGNALQQFAHSCLRWDNLTRLMPRPNWPPSSVLHTGTARQAIACLFRFKLHSRSRSERVILNTCVSMHYTTKGSSEVRAQGSTSQALARFRKVLVRNALVLVCR